MFQQAILISLYTNKAPCYMQKKQQKQTKKTHLKLFGLSIFAVQWKCGSPVIMQEFMAHNSV